MVDPRWSSPGGELLPCPFCGGAAVADLYNRQHWIRCDACNYVSRPFESPVAARAWWNRRATVPAGAALEVGSPGHVALWEAINRYATTCGGDPSKHVYGNTARMDAVVQVERALAASPVPAAGDDTTDRWFDRSCDFERRAVLVQDVGQTEPTPPEVLYGAKPVAAKTPRPAPTPSRATWRRLSNRGASGPSTGSSWRTSNWGASCGTDMLIKYAVRYVLRAAELVRHHGRVTLELRIALERLVYLRQIREHVMAAFGPGAPPRARLHNRELTRHVAERMDVEPSPALGRDVIQAMRAAGWRHVKHARCAWWKGIQRL